MTEPVIRVRGVSKAYRIWHSPAARLQSIALHVAKHLMPPLWARCTAAQTRLFHDFYALNAIDLEVRRGEAVGIVGRNGSGKSTLLQIIAGTLAPTGGTVEINGRVAALLELGSGFNPEYTGRENIFLNASILGLTEEETRARFGAIEAFAEIGEFIEQPVKTYSSGMVVRLAFAVAAHVDPDILIVDEALSVGDARFQLKCARAIDRFLERGVTLLFVSHDLSSVKRLCGSALLLERSRVLYQGRPNDVANLYSKLIADGGSAEAIIPDVAALVAGQPGSGAVAAKDNSPTVLDSPEEHRSLESIRPAGHPAQFHANQAEALLADERAHVQLSGQEFCYGGKLGSIVSISVFDGAHQPRTWFKSGESVTVRMVVESRERLQEPIYALTIKNVSGVEIYGTNTLFSGQVAPPIGAGERYEIDFVFDLNVIAGEFFLSFGFTHFFGENLVVIQRRYDAVRISVQSADRSFGIANLKSVIRTRPIKTVLAKPTAAS